MGGETGSAAVRPADWDSRPGGAVLSGNKGLRGWRAQSTQAPVFPLSFHPHNQLKASSPLCQRAKPEFYLSLCSVDWGIPADNQGPVVTADPLLP